MAEIVPASWRMEDLGPIEFEASLDIPVNNVHYPGGVLPGPVHLLLDDRVSEAIENILQDHNLPGEPEDFNLRVTKPDGEVIVLKDNYPVEDYMDLLQSEPKCIELVTKTPTTEDSESRKEGHN